MGYKKSIGRGDLGFTDIHGKRVSKSSDLIVLNALIDDINALISFLIVRNKKFNFLNKIQEFNSAFMSYNAGYYGENMIKCLIGRVDKLIRENSDFDIKKFVYFTNNETSAILNLIRTRIRIAEIYGWKAKKKKTAVYLNRLSDLFFILAFKYEKKLKIFTSHLEH